METFLDFRDERISANGIGFRCRHAGNGPAVVLLHGWCGSSHSWRKVAPLLAGQYRVVVPDMRGYGDSDKPAQGYDAKSEAADVAGILDHFGIRQAHLVGHDMGAPVALVFSGLYPERALSVTYLDEPLPGYNLEKYTAFRKDNHGGFWQFGMNASPGLAEILYKDHEFEFLTHIFQEMTIAKDAVTSDDVREHASGMLQPGGITGWVGWYRSAYETSAQVRELAEARAFQAPILGYGGEAGIQETAEQLKSVSSDVRGGVFSGSGHLIPEEVPDQLATALLNFFKSISNRNDAEESQADVISESKEPLTIARQAWEELAKAHKSGNFQGYLDRLTDDYRFQMPLGEWREVHVGKAEAARCYAGIAASRPQLTFHEPLRITQHRSTVVIEFEDEGTIAGKSYRNRIASSFDVRGNQICGYREYFGEIDPELIRKMSEKGRS